MAHDREGKRIAAIFDLDGTISDHRKRLHLLPIEGKETKERSYHLFNSAAIHDKPFNHMVALVNALRICSYEIIIITARSEKHRPETVEWLKENGVIYDQIWMRKITDFRSDADIKRSIYLESVADYYGVRFCFDDNDKIVEMWSDLGLPCLKYDSNLGAVK